MKYIHQFLIKLSLIMGIVLCVSCGSKSTTVSQKKVRSGLDKYNDGYDLERGEHGMMQSNSNKKSHFDNLRTSASGGTLSKTDYSKASYRKQRWGGDSQFGKKAYSGAGNYKPTAYKVTDNTSFNKGYTTDGSNFDGQRFATSNTTRERNAGYVRTGNSGYVTSRDNAPDPVIISKDDYNALGVQESNNLLGR